MTKLNVRPATRNFVEIFLLGLLLKLFLFLVRVLTGHTDPREPLRILSGHTEPRDPRYPSS